MNWIYLLISIIAETIGTLALKSSDGFTRIIPTIVVIIGYVIAFFCFSLTLREIPVGLAYAIWAGAGIIMTTILGFFIFKQTLDYPAIIGIFMIVLGVVVINLFSKSVVSS
ncbi:DMT family transporter [Methanospirillum stamsii]|uniref:QacE family quaternary ammonium compound efflux SMR transporter n=1 Tax=Methanospirillum stamsii TaxID=1277351 RepID=A0A2V2N7N8_9EURY|nr:multidrug efflux SMR transporter [Methanospirillum stamsii]PWR74545.1 QacE family quaternary ammonium compound efflux SMR transporter [Methanospirillum stamsii]